MLLSVVLGYRAEYNVEMFILKIKVNIFKSYNFHF